MRVHIQGLPTAEQALAVHAEVFPADGAYTVEMDNPLAKAEGAEPNPFESDFLNQLERLASQHFVNARDAIWRALDGMLDKAQVSAPSQLDQDRLAQALFDLSHANTAWMVGLRVRPEVVRRLQAIGFAPEEMASFPALAYRMQLIAERLARIDLPIPTFAELLTLAPSHPLTGQEIQAVEYAQTRAGMFLKPVFETVGNTWLAERELNQVRDITGRAQAARRHPLEAARELANTERAMGIVRDAERVIRTEIAESRARGQWMAGRAGWSPSTLMVRQPSATACDECRRLYLWDDGSGLRTYTVRQLEEMDALGPNRKKPFHARIGATHPNCVCSPPVQAAPSQIREDAA